METQRPRFPTAGVSSISRMTTTISVNTETLPRPSSDMPRCTGAGGIRKATGETDHCCYVRGVRCKYLVENVSGRRYACSIFLEYGSWAGVNSSPEYREVGQVWVGVGKPFNYCELFDPRGCCLEEGR